MEIKTVQAARPDIHIVLSNDEADSLMSMVIEGKAYADDCGESVDRHENFIAMLSTALAE